MSASEDRARRIAAAREERVAAARLEVLAAAAGDRSYDLEHTHAPIGELGKAAVKQRAKKSKRKAMGIGGDNDELDELLDGGGDDDDDGGDKDGDKDLNAIVKADVQGTAEAVRDSLLSLSTSAVGVKVVYMGVGSITESDVALAAAIGGPILAFNVRSPTAGPSASTLITPPSRHAIFMY